MNCDRIARLYRWMEYAAFGRALERTRCAMLEHAAGARRALVLGDGDGRALAKLLAAAPHVRVDYIDLSGEMLQLARQRAGSERVVYHRANALTIPLPTAEYDLIVTHFFLDCLTENGSAKSAREPQPKCELTKLVSRVAAAAKPGALWIVSEFRDRGLISRWFIRWLYFLFRVTTGLRTNRLTDHHPFFSRDGWRLERIDTTWRSVLSAELWVLDRAYLRSEAKNTALGSNPGTGVRGRR